MCCAANGNLHCEVLLVKKDPKVFECLWYLTNKFLVFCLRWAAGKKQEIVTPHRLLKNSVIFVFLGGNIFWLALVGVLSENLTIAAF
jgi:hypothetical protein